MSLTEAEYEYLMKNSAECGACQHLEALHNGHCCEFCMVDGCSCRWSRWTDEAAGVEYEDDR